MTLRLIHAADLHLDSPLRGLAAYEGAPVERLRSASREAFSALIDSALEQDVHFVVLSGDIWDGDWPDVGAGLFFAAELGRLRQRGIQALMIRGNHDAQSRTRHVISLPDNVYVFGSQRAQTQIFEDHHVAFHGRSFARPDITDNIAIDYPAAQPGLLNIGLLHTALEGHANHARYAPCSLDDLKAKQYDYWALGHVHERQILHAADAAHGGTIAYSGVLQGRQIRETGPKGAWLVEVSSAEARLEPITVDRVRWHLLEVDVSNATTVDAALANCSDALAGILDAGGDERLHAVRVRLVGTTSMHATLCGRRDHLRQELLARVVSLSSDELFLEKLMVDTVPAIDPESGSVGAGALAEVVQLLDQASEQADFQESVFAELQSLVKTLPPAAREELETAMALQFDEFDSASIRRWFDEAKHTLLTELADR